MANEKLEILQLLLETQEKDINIRTISKIRKINYKSAHSAVKKLEKEKIISLNQLGNNTICKFNKSLHPLVFEAEYMRRENIIKNKNLKIIYSRLNSLEFPLIVLLFGSYTDKKKSDIDLLIITENIKETERVISSIPLPIHATVITYKEGISMLKSREFSVVSEAVKKNIIIIGIEEYYRLLKNAGLE